MHPRLMSLMIGSLVLMLVGWTPANRVQSRQDAPTDSGHPTMAAPCDAGDGPPASSCTRSVGDPRVAQMKGDLSPGFLQAPDANTETLTAFHLGSGTGTVSSTPAGITCGVDCTESYAVGTQVTLTATPDSGSAFAGWGSPCSGTGSCQLTMDAAKSISAVFKKIVAPADLLMTMTAAPDPAPIGADIGYGIAVKNNGPATASNAVVTLTLPAGVSVTGYLGVSGCSGGTLGPITPDLVCSLHDLASGETQNFKVTLRPSQAGSLTIPGRVSFTFGSINTDPNDANDSVSQPSTVLASWPPLGEGLTEENNPVLLFTGTWTRGSDSAASGGRFMTSSAAGDSLHAVFNGDGIVVYRRIGPDGGSAGVSVDGKSLGSIRSLFPEERWQVAAVLDGFGSGTHTLDLRVNESGHPVSIDALRVPSPFSVTAAHEQALTRVNVHRAIAGLPLAYGVTAIQLGAQSHAEFYVRNRTDPRLGGLGAHGEQADLPGFTGAGPSDRAAYAGYTGGVGEDMHFLGDPVLAVDGWMNSVYHRDLIMCYGCRELGFGTVKDPNDPLGRADVLDLGSRVGEHPVSRLVYTYPADNQTDVPRTFTGNEIPNPLPSNPYPVGYPVTLYIAQPASTGTTATVQAPRTPGLDMYVTLASSWNLAVAELHTSGGDNVPVYILDQNTDLNHGLGPDVVHMLPQQPLRTRTIYRAHVSGTDSRGASFDKIWSFMTEAPPVTLRITTVNGDGVGMVTSNPGGISCGADCSESYANGTSVTLTATATNGSAFAGWSGDCSGNATCQVTMDDNKTVTATFNPPAVRVQLGRQAVNGTPQLAVTLRARSGCGSIDHIQFGEVGKPFDNAQVTITSSAVGPVRQTTGFTYTPPAGVTAVSLTIERNTSRGGATVSPVHFVDGCGDWRTFIGGGPDAFR